MFAICPFYVFRLSFLLDGFYHNDHERQVSYEVCGVIDKTSSS